MKFLKLLVIIISLQTSLVFSQNFGVNSDPFQTKVGEKPYEMKNYKEQRIPAITFDDCTLWQITNEQNVDVKLCRTQQERVITEYSGKVLYKTKSKDAGFRVVLRKPVLLTGDWDCMNFWNFGAHWLWGEPSYLTALSASVVLKDSDGKEQIIPLSPSNFGCTMMCHKYWFMYHIKLMKNLSFPATFVGFEFKGEQTTPGEELKLYLGPVYVYKEVLKPMVFIPLPDKLPFPLRRETILPINKTKDYSNKIERNGDSYLFAYKGKDARLTYKLNIKKPIGDLSVEYQGEKKSILSGSEIVFENEPAVTWDIVNSKLVRDTLFVNYKVSGKKFTQAFDCFYTINQKSLIWNIEEKSATGLVAEIRLGSTGKVKEGKLVDIPMLVYNYGVSRPSLLCADGLFYFTMFDWYYTNSSLYFPGEKGIKDGYAKYNGGVKYIPLTNGIRNPLRERLFINISPDVQEVFPTIDNPKSPMRSVQADRLWSVAAGDDIETHRKFVSSLRSKGADKVSIRYHEEFWREDGESFTFRSEPNPKLGVAKLKVFADFVKSNDWRVGFYSSYTAFSPTNSLWNEDWIKQGPKGEWDVIWSRCFIPKPSIAWEQEAILAPQIQKIFGTNHSYCDVHTAISPMSAVDYDPREPGAGMFRSVINYYGLMLMNERRAYQGPVYSEGSNHWWYAGLLDGNYANGNLDKMQIFPDFQLQKIHPLEMDAGIVGTNDYENISYALAYGNIGYFYGGDVRSAIRRYALLQPLQNSYSMIPVSEIAYYDGENFVSSSEAVRKDLMKTPQIRLKYESGLQVYVNFSDVLWNVRTNQELYTLPKFGVISFLPGKNLLTYSIENKNSGTKERLDRVYSEDLYYLDTHGENVEGNLAGNGSYLLKREKFGWEIIPIEKVKKIDFNLSLLGLDSFGVDIQALDANGEIIKTITDEPVRDRITFEHKDEYFKYRICPVVTLKN